MNSRTKQIVASFEEAGMTPEEIAQVEALNVEAVKSTLFTYSSSYRESVGNTPATSTKTSEDADFNSEDNDLALRVLRRIAEHSDDDSLALKAAMYIRNDKKKRLDPQKALSNLHVNIAVLNEHFEKAAAHDAAKVLPATKKETIDI